MNVPWIDANDLTEVTAQQSILREGGQVTVYRWRDSNMLLAVDPETNEILNMWEE